MRGIHVAIVTHFDHELNVDSEAVTADVERLIGAGVHGIAANGTVGEGGSLSRDERRETIAIARAVADVRAVGDARVPVCAGISAPTAEQAIVYGIDAISAGADTVMLLPPLLYRADKRELVEFFGSVARAVDLPILLYNSPEGSGNDLKPPLLAELVHEVSSITAIKETSGDARRIAELVNRCPQTSVLVGGDDWALEGFCAGAAGWVSGVATVFPAESVRLWELCQAGELGPAREVYRTLLPLGHLDMTPKLVQYFKAAMDELGLGGGPCRPPRLPLTEAELATVREAVRPGGLQAAPTNPAGTV